MYTGGLENFMSNEKIGKRLLVVLDFIKWNNNEKVMTYP